ncbi:tail fiber domain-containing protein [Bartonella schoenbuchensis]|uniref:Membrane protein n=1 Tax=Bartonella schoenbuchensis m07a TaxID=1094496 RepID=N6VHR8_9HYPH|nr:tail fiber domain-containing protein [Bartonella schoenbuchensis]ENN90587.1 putative membrane protein [Bartonella schoenbuchensis m07a]
MSRRKTPQVQTTTQTNAPPVWSQGILQQASSDALDLYNQGIGGNVYEGDRHAGLSDATLNAIQGLGNAANQFNNPMINQLLNSPTQSQQNLSNMASGGWIGNNSKFNDALDNALSKTSDAVNQSMAGAGRYGSGAHTGVLTDELGALATNAAAQQYNQDVLNMMNANQMIDKATQNQINAANNFYQGQSNAQSNALKGGMVQDANNQHALDVEREKWMEQDNQAWNRLEQLLKVGTTASGNYGTQTGQSVTVPSVTKDPLRDAQQVLGLIGGIMGLSDARVKDNIVSVGEKNGYPLYEFNYKGDPQRYRGVMAQDLVRLKPDAVHMDDKTQLLYVDYDKIGFEMEKVTPTESKHSSPSSPLFSGIDLVQEGQAL